MIHFQYGIPQSSSQLLASRQHQAPPSLDWGLWKLQVFCYVTDPRVRRLCVCVWAGRVRNAKPLNCSLHEILHPRPMTWGIWEVPTVACYTRWQFSLSESYKNHCLLPNQHAGHFCLFSVPVTFLLQARIWKISLVCYYQHNSFG